MRALALLFASILGCKNADPNLWVECNPNGTGYTCVVTSSNIGRSIDACWDIVASCANGASVTASACERTNPESKSTRIVPLKDFAATSRCDELRGVRVENVRERGN